MQIFIYSWFVMLNSEIQFHQFLTVKIIAKKKWNTNFCWNDGDWKIF